MTLQLLPLNTLCLSRLNVRRTERDADIASLAEDIFERGLKQNLVVIPARLTTAEVQPDVDCDVMWEVIAGGRRYQAMQMLVADGRWPADREVACLLEDRADASETSLSENLHKVAMNPADEFAAFHTIVTTRENAGDTRDTAIATCAKRFGKTVRHVEGRLRLATLAPEILDALRADRITLDAAKAYALTTDHDLQRKVFATREKDKYSGHHPNTIRTAIRGETLPLDAALVTFVGLVTYQAEGGRIEGEMFMGSEGEQRVVDVPLLEKLAKAIGEAAVPALAKADGYKSGIYTKGIERYATWPKAPEGFERARDYNSTPTKAQLKKSIGVYAISSDGASLTCVGRFKPAEKRDDPAPDRLTPEQQAELRRKREVGELAARAAVESLDPAELAARATPPRSYWTPSFHEPHDFDGLEVALIVRVTRDEITAQWTAAETTFDAQKAEAESADEETETMS